jgi:hypothetical protein
MNDALISIPATWALLGLGSLTGTIGLLGRLIYSMCASRISALEKRCDLLSRGCGAPICYWRAGTAPDKKNELDRQHENID